MQNVKYYVGIFLAVVLIGLMVNEIVKEETIRDGCIKIQTYRDIYYTKSIEQTNDGVTFKDVFFNRTITVHGNYTIVTPKSNK